MPLPVDNHAPYEQHWIDRGTDRLGLHRYHLPEHHPPAADAAPAVLIWPAMGVPARFYRGLATGLRAAGLAVAVVDLRGTGSSTPRPSPASRYGYAELVDDVGAVLAALAPHLHGRRVLLLGHSLGGQACLLHVARHRAAAPGRDEVTVDGVALVAVGLPYWRSYTDRRRTGVLAVTQSIHAASTLLRVWPGWRFGGRQARGVIRDWAYTARTGRFPALDGTDIEAALAAIDTPVLAISIEHDQYTPAPTVDHLVRKLSAAPVQRVHHGVGEPHLDHFRWARTPGLITDQIVEFAASLPPRR